MLDHCVIHPRSVRRMSDEKHPIFIGTISDGKTPDSAVIKRNFFDIFFIAGRFELMLG
jgi:hypothetical protein